MYTKIMSKESQHSSRPHDSSGILAETLRVDYHNQSSIFLVSSLARCIGRSLIVIDIYSRVVNQPTAILNYMRG